MLVSFVIQKDFIYIFIFMIINFIVDLILKNQKIKISDSLIYYFCDACLIFFYIIERNLSKSKENNLQEESQILTKGFFLMICSLIFNSIYIYKYYDKKKIINNEIDNYLIIIMFLLLIEKITFRNNFYSHQIFSIIIIIILFIYYLINNIIQSKFKLFHILIFLQYYSFSFKYHLIKYLNMNYYINIYLLASINGIFTLIQFLIQYFNILYNEFNFNNISDIILLFIVMMINVYLEFKIISELGLIHRFMSDLISTYISEIIINKKFDLLLIGLLLIISGLIYLEIIQLNFCGLNINIKQNIEKRMDEEFKNQFKQNNIITNRESLYSYNDLVYIQ